MINRYFGTESLMQLVHTFYHVGINEPTLKLFIELPAESFDGLQEDFHRQMKHTMIVETPISDDAVFMKFMLPTNVEVSLKRGQKVCIHELNKTYTDGQ